MGKHAELGLLTDCVSKLCAGHLEPRAEDFRDRPQPERPGDRPIGDGLGLLHEDEPPCPAVLGVRAHDGMPRRSRPCETVEHDVVASHVADLKQSAKELERLGVAEHVLYAKETSELRVRALVVAERLVGPPVRRRLALGLPLLTEVLLARRPPPAVRKDDALVGDEGPVRRPAS